MAEEPTWVRLVFVDVFGGAHAVVLPGARFEAVLETGAPFDGSALEGRARHLEADMLLKPDGSTLRSLGGGLSRAVCWVRSSNDRVWPGDPRTALASVVAAADDVGQGYRAAAELEFYLLDPEGQPVDRGAYFGDLEGPGLVVARAAAERLCGLGVDVISAHLEAGPGQYELDLAALAPLALADALVLAKQVVREVARTAGLRATFMGRPFSSEAGSGLHLHQHVDGGLFDEKGNLDEGGRAFLAGQLHHAPGLAALAAPTVNSYKRLHSGPEAPSAIVWAHSNRAALLRVGWSGERRPAVEFRLADPSANPYLLIAGLVAAAAHGIEAGLDPGSPFDEDLGGWDPRVSQSSHLKPLPRDLDAALDALLADDVLMDAFDSRLLNPMVEGRRSEAQAYRAQVTPWELDQYLDEA